VKAKKTWNAWTTCEDAILREIWEYPEPIKVNMHRLPTHSYRGIVMRAMALGLESRRNGRAIKCSESACVTLARRALEAHGPFSVRELARASGVSYRRVYDIVKQKRADIHICGWKRESETGQFAAVWKWGVGEDVPRPAPLTRSQREHRRHVRSKSMRIRSGETVRSLNPFATAAGLASAPPAMPGRIIKHLFDDELEAA
jgi:hypothetical protein